MIQNAAQYATRILETYVTESLALRSVPPAVLRDELESVRDRVSELMKEVDAAGPGETDPKESARAAVNSS